MDRCPKKQKKTPISFCKCIWTLSQLLIKAGDIEFVVTMSAQEYVHLEVEFDLIHPYVPTGEDILNILGASKVYEIIEDDLESSEVVVPSVSFSQAQEAMATLSTFLE